MFSKVKYLLLVLPFLFFSCSDDGDETPPIIKGDTFLSGGSWDVKQVLLEFTADGTNWNQSTPAVGYKMSYAADSSGTWVTTATFHDQVANYFQTSQDPLFLQNGEYSGKWWWSEATNLPASLDVQNYHYGYLNLDTDYRMQTINNAAGDSMWVSHLGPANPDKSQYRAQFLLVK